MNLSSEEIGELLKLANSGDTSAQIELTARYAKGDDIEQNSGQAVFWYDKAAKEQEPVALYNLAGSGKLFCPTFQCFRFEQYWKFACCLIILYYLASYLGCVKRTLPDS
ncbi:MAG: hypothetical protein ABL925_11400 [Methylococcales bacterium]